MTGGMTNFYSFIWGSLEWPFKELFLSNALLWNQYNFIAFNYFSCNNLIIYRKILIITVISNETTNKLTICAKLCRNVTIFYRQYIVSLCQVQEKLRACGNSKQSFSSSCFIAGDIRININKNAILNSWDNVHLLKHYPIKCPQKCLDSFNCTN